MSISRITTLARVVWLEMVRRKDLYILLILLVAMLFYLLSLETFGLRGAVGYVKDIGLLLTWLFSWILAIITGARQLPQEERSGTIFPLLAKPITRGDLIVGKWLGAWGACLFATGIFYVAVAGVIALQGGSFDTVTLVQAFTLHVALLGILTALTVMFTTKLNMDAAATLAFVVVISCSFVVPKVPELVLQATGSTATALLGLYYALPHFELFDMRIRLIHNWGPAPWPAFGLVLAYAVAWTALFLFLAWHGYRAKRFKRGAAA